MKAGIITFHWAANYGAVLQAYALQTYLKKIGIEAQIINYCPEGNRQKRWQWIVSRSVKAMKRKKAEYEREQGVKIFRNQYLDITDEYKSEQELKQNPPKYDVYISGSDQIWNPYFTMHGEGGVTLPYYLSFVPEGKCRISYASSFGVPDIPEEMKALISKELKQYSHISVRESTGKTILANLNISSQVVADPTLLLEKSDYTKLAKSVKNETKEPYVFSFVLHEQYEQEKAILKEIQKEVNIPCKKVAAKASVETWINTIKNADFVLTNSFHCTVFCLIFGIPFITFESGKQKMGDRLRTLLSNVGLENRFIAFSQIEKIKDILNTEINWEEVEQKIKCMRHKGQTYLQDALGISDCSRSVLGIDAEHCTGCGLCASVCPRQCIRLEQDSRGFKIPKIDSEKCINCGLCQSKCILNDKNQQENNMEPKVFSVCHKEFQVKKESSSGGAFTALAEAILNEHGVVYGAAYTGNLKVEHIAVEKKEELYKLRGSKYIQSQAEKAYSEIKQYVQQGRKVLFCGTPCQVAALKCYVGNVNNLYCIDLACHGVPSNKIVLDFCSSQAAQYGKVPSSIDFRDKRTGWKNFSLTLKDKNGAEIVSVQQSNSDYFRGYVDNLFLRPSCIDCRFAKIPRQGDITLADCWYKVHNGQDTEDTGISAVLLNTEKGTELFAKASNQMIYEEEKLSDVVQGTPLLMHGATANPQSESFWRVYENQGYEKAIKQFEGKESLLKKVYRHLQHRG